ncbi:hypothetical protein VNO78_25376 [Psophocarpus tetragonolobus]|uniref:Alpha/beta hydrolase fold-3 domain-containing protein n=1 Tax=Psophocarpus tetragonolobus TaxID=3891 RepID=A0AAN9S6F0_PSOTE
MSEASSPAMDPYEFLKIKLNPDGKTLSREYMVPMVPPSPTPSSEPALSKDIPLNPATKTSIRLFLPNPPPGPAVKIPLLIYFHGGGFILYHPSSLIFHQSSSALSASLPALVASVDYRLCPEHRLPAAYEDAVDALRWAQAEAQEPSEAWLRDHADFSKCFLMGSSAGGNIACFAALRALDIPLSPLKIAGVIMNVPYFSGVQRSDSELRLVNDRIVPLPANDLMWSLSLPEGADRDHLYCNPTTVDSHYGDNIGRLPACFINGYAGDPLVDKQKDLANIFQARGVRVHTHFFHDGYHAVEIFDKAKALALVDNIKKFIHSVITQSSI